MAHNIEVIDGRASMFSYGFTPWHAEETNPWVLDTPPEFDRALDLMRARFEVEVREVSYGAGRISRKAWLTVRTDRNIELGSCGAQYHAMQNEPSLGVLRPLVDAGVLELTSGATLGVGEQLFLLAQFNINQLGPNAQEVFGGEVLPYVLVRIDHTGGGKNRVQLTLVRVQCANTLRMADSAFANGREAGIEVSHHKGGEQRLVEGATIILGDLIAKYERQARDFRLLKNARLTPDQFGRLVLDKAAPCPLDDPAWNPEARMANAVMARWERKTSVIIDRWHNGKGHTGDDSAWEAYNGVIEVIDHDKELFPIRAGVWRSAALMDGRLKELKDDIYAGILTAAGGSVAEA
jgi:hypothetical protein